jgi:hemolysin activation/secretion protein
VRRVVYDRLFYIFFFFVVFLLPSLMVFSVFAQATLDAEELRRRAQEEAEQQKRRQEALDVHLEAGGKDMESLDLPAEKPCFVIKSLIVEGDGSDDFSWAQPYLNNYSGKCVGKEGINLIVKRLTGQFVERGYITTRVGVPEQDLATGTLKLKLIRGVIRKIRFSNPNVYGTWRSAFPARSGDLLNLRDLEQGLEQMKRVPYQDVDMQIVPGDIPGESDVVINVKRSKFWKVSLSLNDSGSKATGKMQYAANFSLDNPLGLNDIFTIGANHDAEYSSSRGVESYNLYYSVPWGYWTFNVSWNTYRYHQDVIGITQNFDYSGASDTFDMSIQRLLYRGQFSKTSLQFRVNRYHGESFIEDVEIEVQRRNKTYAELALLHRHYVGQAQIDASLGYRQGTTWFNATEDAKGWPGEYPTHYYTMGTLEAGASVPFKLNMPLRYVCVFRGQFTNNNLFYSETFSIGNRWTVRGFDGEQTLAAERGYLIRNELEVPIAKFGQAVYAGIDYGYVDGPGEATLLGKRLIGSALGLRGAWKWFSYDLFGGWPIYKPDGYKTEHFTIAFQAGFQF